MFPEKLHFENSSLRTGRVNEAVKFIYMIDSNLGGNKKGQAKNKSALSCKVGVAGFEPTTSTSQMWRDTGLRYTPNNAKNKFLEAVSVNRGANLKAFS